MSNAAVTMPMRAPVIVLEDHPMMRETLSARVMRRGDTQIVYSGASIEEAVAVARRVQVACIVLDLDLGDGSVFTENLHALGEVQAPILVVSATATPRALQVAMAQGVKGYVSKSSPSDEFAHALDAVIEGRPYLSTDLAALLASNVGGGVVLSAQEQRALLLYSSGMKIDSVARKMGVTSATAKEYIRRVRQKYAAAGTPVPTKVELFRQAEQEGLVARTVPMRSRDDRATRD